MEYYALHLWPLWLLLALAAFAALTLRSLSSGSRAAAAAAFAIRALVFIAMVLALAEIHAQRRDDRLAVMFVVDKSFSVPSPVRENALNAIRAARYGMDQESMAGMVVFGEGACIEANPDPEPDFSRIASVVSPERTDIGAAIRLALAAFPKGVQRRIVVISDGNQNSGDAVREAMNARAEGAVVDAVPLFYDFSNDVRVDKVVAPSQALADTSVPIRVVLNAHSATRARLYLRQDGVLVAQDDVDLEAGKNIIYVERPITSSGFHTFEVQVDSSGDGLPQNNRGFAFTIVGGKPRVLAIDSDPAGCEILRKALETSGMTVDVVSAAAAPSTAAEFHAWDSLILSNVDAGSFSIEQLKAVQAAVRDLGMGLIMIGGEKSFGAGDWNDTPVEEALPVWAEVKQKKVLPNGALVLVMHTCEFSEGNEWTKRICREAIKKLTSEDLVGLIYYDMGTGPAWLFDLQPAGDKEKLFKLIRGINPGDMPDFDAALRMAHASLRDAPAALKHIVIVSDGDPQPPNGITLLALQKSTITATTVCINPHPGDQNALSVMKKLAKDTGGRFYFPASPEELPGILIREAAVVKRNYIKEEEFVPVFNGWSELLKGAPEGGLPPLLGRVICSEKPTAALPLVSPEGDPVLAHWRYGLGRSLAFTSDAKNRWAAHWVGWDGFARFWAQAVTWSLRTLTKNNFRVNASVESGRGAVVVDAIDASGAYIEGLKMEARAVSPSSKSSVAALRQTAPGRYEADFDASEVGTYPLMVTYEDADGNKGAMASGMAAPYSAEYRTTRPDPQFMEELARAGGGRLRDSLQGVFDRDLPSSENPLPQWKWLLLAASFLFVLDVFNRRVALPWARMSAAVATAGRKVFGAVIRARVRSGAQRDEAMAALLRKKAEVARERTAEAAAFAAAPGAEEQVIGKDGPDARPAAPAAPQAAEAGPAADDAFTKRLLDAKKRAWKKDEGGA